MHTSDNKAGSIGDRSPTRDLVFFNNTWDYNGDGKVNDSLTHIGIVERQEPDGTVIFISRVASAVKRYHMNLRLPHVHKTADGRILNDYLRRKVTSDPQHQLPHRATLRAIRLPVRELGHPSL